MRLRLSMMLLSGLLLAGCSPVFVNEPIGKQVDLDMEHIEKIEGRWQASDSLFEVKHLDGSRFKITKIETDPEKTKESTTAIITQTDKEHTYFHIKESDDAERYMLLRLGFAGGKGSEHPGEVVLYMANVRSFAKAVEAGKLKGTIGRKDDDKPETVKLTSSAAEIEAWLQDQENEPFVLGHVFVARKVNKDD